MFLNDSMKTCTQEGILSCCFAVKLSCDDETSAENDAVLFKHELQYTEKNKRHLSIDRSLSVGDDRDDDYDDYDIQQHCYRRYDPGHRSVRRIMHACVTSLTYVGLFELLA